MKAKGGRETSGKTWDQRQALFERFQVGRVLDVSGRLERTRGDLPFGPEPLVIKALDKKFIVPTV